MYNVTECSAGALLLLRSEHAHFLRMLNTGHLDRKEAFSPSIWVPFDQTTRRFLPGLSNFHMSTMGTPDLM